MGRTRAHGAASGLVVDHRPRGADVGRPRAHGSPRDRTQRHRAGGRRCRRRRHDAAERTPSRGRPERRRVVCRAGSATAGPRRIPTAGSTGARADPVDPVDSAVPLTVFGTCVNGDGPLGVLPRLLLPLRRHSADPRPGRRPQRSWRVTGSSSPCHTRPTRSRASPARAATAAARRTPAGSGRTRSRASCGTAPATWPRPACPTSSSTGGSARAEQSAERELARRAAPDTRQDGAHERPERCGLPSGRLPPGVAAQGWCGDGPSWQRRYVRVDPVGSASAARETNWRQGYLPHFRRLVEAGLLGLERCRRDHRT